MPIQYKSTLGNQEECNDGTINVFIQWTRKRKTQKMFRRKRMDIEKAASSKIISIEDAISILLCKHCFEDFQFYYEAIHIDVVVLLVK